MCSCGRIFHFPFTFFFPMLESSNDYHFLHYYRLGSTSRQSTVNHRKTKNSRELCSLGRSVRLRVWPDISRCQLLWCLFDVEPTLCQKDARTFPSTLDPKFTTSVFSLKRNFLYRSQIFLGGVTDETQQGVSKERETLSCLKIEEKNLALNVPLCFRLCVRRSMTCPCKCSKLHIHLQRKERDPSFFGCTAKRSATQSVADLHLLFLAETYTPDPLVGRPSLCSRNSVRNSQPVITDQILLQNFLWCLLTPFRFIKEDPPPLKFSRPRLWRFSKRRNTWLLWPNSLSREANGAGTLRKLPFPFWVRSQNFPVPRLRPQHCVGEESVK